MLKVCKVYEKLSICIHRKNKNALILKIKMYKCTEKNLALWDKINKKNIFLQKRLIFIQNDV